MEEETLNFLLSNYPIFVFVVFLVFYFSVIGAAAFLGVRAWRKSKVLTPTPRPNRKPYDEGSFRK